MDTRRLRKHLSSAPATGSLVAMAMLGVIAGTSAGCKSQDRYESVSSADKHACKGLNACKGQGGCATASNACAGKNACKGQGGCATADKHACKGMNACKGQGGCSTGDNGCAGKNSCKGKGGCEVPVPEDHK